MIIKIAPGVARRIIVESGLNSFNAPSDDLQNLCEQVVRDEIAAGPEVEEDLIVDMLMHRVYDWVKEFSKPQLARVTHRSVSLETKS